MTTKVVKNFFASQKNGTSIPTPTDSEYWWKIIDLYHQGYDPDDDGMITIPVDQLEVLQQAYTSVINTLEEIASDETIADIAREQLTDLGLK